MNNNAPWVFETVRAENGDEKMLAFLKTKTNVKDVSYKPFSSDIKELFDPEDFGVQTPILKGSIELCSLYYNYLKKKNGYDKEAGLFYHPAEYNVSSYLPYFEHTNLLINSDSRRYSSCNLWENRWEIFRDFSKDSHIFIRPDDGNKTFAGQLVDLQQFEHFVNSIPAKTLVFCSSTKKIRAEWRCIINNNYPNHSVAASSLYRYDGNSTYVIGCPKEVEEIALAACVFYRPDSIFVIDVALMDDNSYKVIEYNAFSCSAIYAANPESVFKAAQEAYTRNIKFGEQFCS